VLIREIFLKRLATNRLLIARSRAAWDARDPEIYTIDVIATSFTTHPKYLSGDRERLCLYEMLDLEFLMQRQDYVYNSK
jgi:hypothetical protein